MDFSTPKGKDHFDRRTVNDVSGTKTIGTGTEQIAHVTITARCTLVDAKDCANTHVAVNVTRTIERVKGDAEFALFAARNDNRFFIFFRNQHRANAGMRERINHHFIRQDVELFLIVARTIHFTGQSVELGHTGTLYGRCDEFARCGNGIQQNDQVMIVRAGHDEPTERLGILLLLVVVVTIKGDVPAKGYRVRKENLNIFVHAVVHHKFKAFRRRRLKKLAGGCIIRISSLHINFYSRHQNQNYQSL
jgi:hypothetical protein